MKDADFYQLNLSSGLANRLESVDNWKTHASANCVSALATNLVPKSERDAAFCMQLSPGVYTGEVATNIADVATTSVDVLQ